MYWYLVIAWSLYSAVVMKWWTVFTEIRKTKSTYIYIYQLRGFFIKKTADISAIIMASITHDTVYFIQFVSSKRLKYNKLFELAEIN